LTDPYALLPQTEKDTTVGPFCNRDMDLGSRLYAAGQKLKSGDIPLEDSGQDQKTLCQATPRWPTSKWTSLSLMSRHQAYVGKTAEAVCIPFNLFSRVSQISIPRVEK